MTDFYSDETYKRPSLDFFNLHSEAVSVDEQEIEENKRAIVNTLREFRIAAEIVRVTTGPSFARYEITIPKDVMAKRVARYADNIEMSLQASSINIYSNFTQGTVAIEVPNRKRSVVGMRDMLQSEAYLNAKPGSLTFCIGKNVEGELVCDSLTKMPHMLVAGATGSGKSVFLNELIISLIMKYSPEEVRLILIDPKQIEFTLYDQLPHLMINEIISDVQKTIVTFNWLINEMERRYELFNKLRNEGKTVRNIDEYNAAMTERAGKLPKIVVIVDELADLMVAAKKDIEDKISRIAAKARAAGIHLVLATQRPSVDVVTGVLKANIPSRFAFRVASSTDSSVILDEPGAEKLLGSGDLLYKTGSMFGMERVQGAWLDSSEIQRVCDFIRKHNEAYYDESVANFINNEGKAAETGSEAGEGKSKPESLYIDALRYVVQSGSVSMSILQRKFAIGYNKAGKIMEWMESKGYISPFDGSKSRKIYVEKEDLEDIIAKDFPEKKKESAEQSLFDGDVTVSVGDSLSRKKTDTSKKVRTSKLFEAESSDVPVIEPAYIEALRLVMRGCRISPFVISKACGVDVLKACQIIEWMENSGYITSPKALLSPEKFKEKYGDL